MSTESSNNDPSNEYLKGCPSETSMAGQADMCKGCPGQGLCKSQGGVDPDQQKINLRMKPIKHKIMVVSGKGGVGKSTIATQLSLALSEREKKVAILDVDICGPSVPRILNVEGKQIMSESYGWIPIQTETHPNLSIMSVQFMLADKDNAVVWRGPRKTNLIKTFLRDVFWGRQDFMIIDTPPGTSDEHISTITALKQANPDGVLIVTTPQEVSLATIRKEMKINVLGLVENMSGYTCPCCDEVSDIFSGKNDKKDASKKLCEEYKINYFGQIPLDPRISQSIDLGQCIFCTHPKVPAVVALNSVVDSILKLVVKEDEW